MSHFYVLPPQDKYSGAFIISTNGVGYIRRFKGKDYLLKYAEKPWDDADERVCELRFECDGKLYRWVPGLKTVGKYPAMIVNGRRVVAPKALRPFADPDTIIRPM